jgi:hypothetical protein
MGQDREERIDGFFRAQHSQAFNGPEARLLIGVTRIQEKSGENRGGLNTAITEGSESPESQKAAIGAAVNLMDEPRKALWRLLKMIGREVYFHGGGADARIVCFQGREHEMKEAIRIFQPATPGVEILVNQIERRVGVIGC